MNTASPVSDYLRGSLRVGVVLGTVAGLGEGSLTWSRNVYVPQFALLCLTAPIVLTTLLLSFMAVPVALFGRLRRWPIETVPARVGSWLAGAICLFWALIWWLGIATQAQSAGGAGLFLVVPLVPLLALSIGIGAGVWVLLGDVAAVKRGRWMAWAPAASAALNVLLLVPLGTTAFNEGRRFLSDTVVGEPRRAAELNILLVTIDTLRADRLEAFGRRKSAMPNLDRLADQGVAFTAAISQSPWTLPAIASVFTGLPPGSHGAGRSVNAFDLLARTALPTGIWTFTQTLHAHGYLTQAFVTNPYLSMRYGFGSGFDRYENVTMESEAFVALGGTLVFRVLTWLWPRLIIGDVGETVTSRALPWIERHRNEKFFLWLHYLDVHAPYGDPRTLGNKSFRGEILRPGELPSLVFGVADGHLGDRFVPIAHLRAGEIHLDATQRQQLVDLYDAGVRYEDEQVGRVLDEIDRLGLRDNTLVIVASDHGEEFWEHGGVEHGHTVYDELVRVPLIVRWPGGPSGKRVADVVRLMDIAPTILDLTGCHDPHVPSEARSLRVLLEDGRETPRAALSEGLLFADEKQALRTRNFKYIVWASGKEELYDLQADPREQRDLAAREDLLGAQRAMMRDLLLMQRSPILPLTPRGDGATTERLRALGYVE